MREPLLFQPLNLGKHAARNHLVMPPMCQYSVYAEDGLATSWHHVHYASRAYGGFGTVIVEATAVTPEGRISPFDLGLWNDEQIPAIARVVDAIHEGGALAGVQLNHAGRKAGMAPWEPTPRYEGIREGWNLLGASTIPADGLVAPRALDKEGIDRIVDAFAQAARRAVEAGFDLIEIHGAHGYLIHQFLSPLSNDRQDEYGGSEENRQRFAREVVDAVRAAIGERATLGIRISATDWLEEGLTAEETTRLSQRLAGRLDFIHVSTGGNVSAPIPIGPGYQVPFADRIRRALGESDTKVIAVGMITSSAQAEQAVATGQCDAVAVGRVALTDPYVAARWAHELRAPGDHLPAQYWRGTWA